VFVTSRRQFVTATAALIAMLRDRALFAAAAPSHLAAGNAAFLNTMFDEFMDDRLRNNPEDVTLLGLDKGKFAGAKSKLTENSVERVHEANRENAAHLKRLRAFPRGSLTGSDLANYDTIEFTMETHARASAFDYGDLARPYVVSPLTGAYQRVPTFLDQQHKIESREDVDAYLARLRDFALVLDQETERVRHDAAVKVIPPDFLIERTLLQLKKLRNVAPEDSILTSSVTTRARAIGVTGNYGLQAARLVETAVYPALDRQYKVLRDLGAHAAHAAGVAHIPEGAAFYQLALRQATSAEMTADEAYQLGLDRTMDLRAHLDALLRAEGRTTGTVAERLNALAKDPQYHYPNTDAGRQQLLEYCNGLIEALQARLPQYFRVMPKAPVEIRRMLPYTEPGAAIGYYQTPALDGSRPSTFSINLRDMNEWPRWKLPTLVYHESEPGHHLQLALVFELPSLPLLRKTSWDFSANIEGWALYAEQLADEMGLYDSDPLARLGMLQSALSRAARCVIDTGLHARGWSRERAIDYMAETTGEVHSRVATEVDRYCTLPAQTTSYLVGQTRWLRLREEARRRLGARFDIRDFHDVGLSAAPMPLAVLERIYDDWMKGRGA
jgi:uncharacterized protein (DUF885 family)